MKYDPAIHKRRSIRLKGYDYSRAGLYFITICVQNKELLFGKIENNEMILNDAGKMIQAEWEKLPQRFSNIELDEFVVMPNHFHGILEIVGATLVVALNDTVAPNASNDMVDPNASNDTVAPNASNDTVAPNASNDMVDPNASNDMVDPNASNDTESKNEPRTPNDVGQPAIRATTRVAPTNDIGDNNELDSPNITNPKNVTEQPTTGATTRVAPTGKTVGEMMAAFKSITTVNYIDGVKNSGWQSFDGKLWQRNYYEHIIRNVHAHENISDYITCNPTRWQDDKFYRI